MNGLLESIVRRRRASASNGGSPPAAHVNGSVPTPVSEAVAAPESETAAPPAPSARPGFLERGRLRRRAGYLRALREIQLRELGAFLVELHRFGRQRPELAQAKVAEAAATDRELRALDRALDSDTPITELRQAGIGGRCAACGAVHGSADKFCASCGRALTDG